MELNKYIEHTLLKPNAVKADFIKLFEEAKEYNFYGVCVNPNYVKLAAEHLKKSKIKIITVVGFPLGANTSGVKAYEAAMSIISGADEIDMVMNITALKNYEYDLVIEDIKKVKKACKKKRLKVILETGLLTRREIRKACELCVLARADFVKTSTGFARGGAKTEDVKLMYDTVSPYGLRVKASGGIRDKETALKMIEAGASRLGTSSGAAIMTAKK
ncbi:MAG: deoxyribose-phosphate aldolase [Heliobacteriaceae bacterium]|jgi:deoxyribose-phosphate aldolase|nr:deoxyribose-phosphate aldolase [Heliobacteriaceae bacterium]